MQPIGLIVAQGAGVVHDAEGNLISGEDGIPVVPQEVKED